MESEKLPFLADREEEHDWKCDDCSHRQQNTHGFGSTRYWFYAFVIHACLLAMSLGLTIFFSTRLDHSHKEPTVQRPGQRSLYSPASDHVRYKTDTPAADYWENEMFTGEPSYRGDYAWNYLMDFQGLRLEKHEAERLNVTAAPLPNEGYATMFGVYHNLHCIRRIRQHLFEDYYYPNRTTQQREADIHHNYHCLEAVRTSIMCNPDLTPHPLRWAEHMPDHPLVANPNVVRECVDWDYLHEFMAPRKYHLPQVLKGMRETGQRLPGEE